MSEKVINNWLALAEYDFETGKAMFAGGRYIYVVFTCQQAVEKTLKALYVKQHETAPPYVHNLFKLAEALSFYSEFSERQIKEMERLNSYYVQSRYSEQIQEMMAQLSREQAAEFLRVTEELLKWLRGKL